jgi:predicted transcriptional regulator
VVLISIHPAYVEKIMNGEKNLEFRRTWPAARIGTLVIYATSPVMLIAGLVEVESVARGSGTSLWRMAREVGGGIPRQALRDYLNGKDEGVALKLGRRMKFGDGVSPQDLFGTAFKPPQSYRYVKEDELKALVACVKAEPWK